MTAISASQSTDSSWAFFIRPPRRLENVTCLLVGFSIFLISIFPRPIGSFPICGVVFNPYKGACLAFVPALLPSCLCSRKSLSSSASVLESPQSCATQLVPVR
ncbi:hypothetical protein Mapa_002027 [Marchantia paleacea]|nr:hypothetical protein Mapa_002027 [Marchantia paleacea]